MAVSGIGNYGYVRVFHTDIYSVLAGTFSKPGLRQDVNARYRQVSLYMKHFIVAYYVYPKI